MSLHIFALKTSSVLQYCPCVPRYLFVFFRLLLRCGVFGITFFATKNSPNQPKLCEVPRCWNHKKHVFFSYFCLLGPPISLHMFCLKTSSGLQNCPFGRQYVFFFVRCRFTCLAYLGGLSFDFCECFTLFNDEALNFLTFYTQTAKAVCDACTLLPCSPIYLQGGLGGTNEPQVCDATPKRFFICVLWKTSIFHQKTAQVVWRTLMGKSQKTQFFSCFFLRLDEWEPDSCASKSVRREIPLLKNEGVCDPRIFAHRMILCTRGGIAQKASFGPKKIGAHVEEFKNRACAFFCASNSAGRVNF